MKQIVRTEDEINRVLNWAVDDSEFGSNFPGMSYEDGVREMYDWLVGDSEDAPDDD